MAASASPVKLVIFDCDGVLVDSEPLSMRVMLETLAEHGLDYSENDAYEHFLGRSLATVRNTLRNEHTLELNDAALQTMRDRLFALFRAELGPMDGIAAALDALPADLGICVASSSQPERIRLSLEVTGLLPRFEGRIFSAAQVANGKPAPDLFLHAARTCGVAPEQCLVVEDSPSGIRAAKAAGMRVVAFTGGEHIARANLYDTIAALEPDFTLDAMSGLPGVVEAARPAPAASGGSEKLLLAVDVGTASVRAGLVTETGTLRARTERPIDVHRNGGDFGAYSSQQIWTRTCEAVREALGDARADGADVVGIGFDATCSMVVLDENNDGLGIGPGGDPELDTIAWFDHRAMREAREITETGHEVLKYSGGVISPEMEVPKLVWLKRHMRDVWDRAGKMLDLADFMTFKATGSLARSQSTLTAKWCFLAHEEDGWRRDFFERFDIADLFDRARLPNQASSSGARIGPLTPGAAADLGLTTNCSVATGMVDAHAGALGILGAFANRPEDLHRHLGLVAGTSSCIMALSVEPRPISGVWGPYYGAVLPGTWLNEGGQSATGALLDHIIRWHSAGGEPTAEMHRRIIARVGELRAIEGANFAARLHVLPDFHGNRSPLAEPDAVGVISGLTLDSSFDSLCRLYWRTAVGIALGLRHILEALNERGYGIDTLHIAGGHTRNPLLMELYADATGCAVVTQDSYDAVIRGTIMTAASAAGLYPDLATACEKLSALGPPRRPNPDLAGAYEADYRVFLQMHEDRRRLDKLTGTVPETA